MYCDAPGVPLAIATPDELELVINSRVLDAVRAMVSVFEAEFEFPALSTKVDAPTLTVPDPANAPEAV
jgi:hypothetical protein